MYYVFRFITSIWIYLAGVLLAALIVVFVSRGKDVFSMRWMPSLTLIQNEKIGTTNQVRNQAIGDRAVKIAYANMSLGELTSAFMHSGEDDAMPTGSTFEQSIQLIEMLQEFREGSLVLLQSQVEQSIFSDIMSEGSNFIGLGSRLLASLDTDISRYRSKTDTCEFQKSQADDLYNQSLLVYDSDGAQKATKQAQEANVCIGQNSTLANSYYGVYNDLSKELNRTSRFLTLIEQNKQLILDYGGLLPTDTPDLLRRLQQDLRKI